MESYWSATAAGTNSGATAAKAAQDNRMYVVTAVSGHGDADSVITVKDGTTIIWESKIDVSVEGTSFHFAGLTLPCSSGNKAEGAIASSSADCQITISGIL
jgi:hypothetical protein|tara:strand:+ start:2207 stop:2509 length:303 start_codon:yes stop_codon:yes gene_type:complete